MAQGNRWPRPDSLLDRRASRATTGMHYHKTPQRSLLPGSRVHPTHPEFPS